VSDRTARIDWAIFAALGLFWGSSYLFIKIGVETLSPFTLIAGRLAVGATLLAVVLAASSQRLPRNRRTYGHLAVMAVLNIVIPFSLITWGEQSIDSALASILNASVPLFTIVLAALFLADEPITVNRVVGLLVGFGGVVVLTGPSLSGSGGSLTGELAMIGSSIAYASGNVYARRYVRGLHPMVTSFFQVFFALLATAALALLFERPLAVSVQPSTILSVLWLGVFGSALAYLAFFRLHARWGSTRSSLVAYVLPVVGIALGFLVLHEAIDIRVLAGTALIIGGVALVNSRFAHRRLASRAAARVETRPG
jgi:drug/metabolite transporter (DMT)-like permease